jgi:type III secretion protein J
MLWLTTALLLLSGCTVPVAAKLDERDANMVTDALNRSGVSASKEVDPGSEGRYRVVVGRGDTAQAISVLREHDLPPRHAPGVMEAVGKGALVPSALAEHAQYVAGLSGDLERSLASIDGVLGARVHLSIPKQDPLAVADKKQLPTASVLLRYDGSSSPIPTQDIQQLVAGAVADLSPERVQVIALRRSSPSSVVQAKFQRVGPISVSPGSAGLLRGLFAAALLVSLILSATIVVLWWRLHRAAPPVEVPGEPS